MRQMQLWSAGVWNGVGTPAERRLTGDAAIWRWTPPVFRYVERFFGDVVLPDTPVVDVEGATEEEAAEFRRVARYMFERVRHGVHFLIRYGCCVLVVRDAGPAVEQQIEVIDPRYWLPIRDGDDWRVGDEDLIIRPWTSTRYMEVSPDRVSVWHFRRSMGWAARRLYELHGESVGGRLRGAPERVGMPGVFVARIGEGEYGESSFPNLVDAAAELRRRYSELSEVFDENLFPHLAVPQGTMARGSGAQELPERGSAIPVPPGGAPPSYVVWNPRTESIEADIQRGWDEVFRIAGIAGVLVDRHDVARGDLSGAALERLARVTVARIMDLRDALDEPCRGALCSVVGMRLGRMFEPTRVTLLWPPALGAASDMIEGTARAVETGLMSRVTGVQRVSRVTSAEARQIAMEFEARQAAQLAMRQPFGGQPMA